MANKFLADLIKRVEDLDASARVGALDPDSAQKLSYAEFGTQTAPPRPVLSETWYASKATQRRVIKQKIGKVLLGKKQSGEEILKDVADDFLELVQEELHAGFGDPLEQSTIDARRRRGNLDSTQLIDPSILKDGEKTMAESLTVETKPDVGDWD